MNVISWLLLVLELVIGAVIGVIVGRIDKRQQKREKARKELEFFQIQMIAATAALCKANSIALKNGKCNGETKAALEYLERVKHDQRDFLYTHGLDDII